MYLYYKNTLKYVEIVGREPKSMILNIEACSNISVAPWQFDCSEYKEMTIKCFLSNKERIICVFAIVLHYVPNNPYMNVNTRPPFLDVSLGLTVCNKWLLPAHPQVPNNMTLPF